MGAVSAGDMLTWTRADCGTITTLDDPTDGTDAATTFTFAEAGTYRLCYQRSGEPAAVEQPGISVDVGYYAFASEEVGDLEALLQTLEDNPPLSMRTIRLTGESYTLTSPLRIPSVPFTVIYPGIRVATLPV